MASAAKNCIIGIHARLVCQCSFLLVFLSPGSQLDPGLEEMGGEWRPWPECEHGALDCAQWLNRDHRVDPKLPPLTSFQDSQWTRGQSLPAQRGPHRLKDTEDH